MPNASPNLAGLRVLFAGSGEFGCPSLQRLRDAGATLVRVYTQPDKPAGRGHALTPTPIGQWALANGIELVRTVDINSEPLPAADVLVVIAFGQKLAPPVVEHARLGSINLHASRLPRHRGAAPINWAVIQGDATTGNSVIRLAQKMDAGAVLAMSEIFIGPLETAGEVHDRLSLDGAALVEHVLIQLLAGTARPLEQDERLATKAPKLSREAARIDWTRDARAIANQIRGLHPWPGCRVQMLDPAGRVIDRLTLIRAVPDPTLCPELKPGTMHAGGAFACGSGAVRLMEIHPDGKRPLPFDAYRNGRQLTGGETLVSI